MQEKVIADYPTYNITSTGYVRDLRTGNLHDGCCINGYRKKTLTNPSGKCSFLIHRLVGEAFIPNPDNLPEIDHINRNSADNRVENLRWVNDFTQSQNRGDQKNNTSGYKNICLEDNYFRVVITRNGITESRKRFSILDDAIKFRDSEYLRLGI